MAELQVIPARHGTATFVPAGQTIKIINTSGSQVVDTWAFALPKPEPKKGSQKEGQDGDQDQEGKKDESMQETSKSTPAKKPGDMSLPSQEEAEKATQDGLKEGEASANDAKDAKDATPQKGTWTSYVPSMPTWSSKRADGGKQETEQQKNSRAWASYFPSGKGFSNYVPKTATDTVSAFASTHQRDTNKTYLEQLQDFSKTPVGAAGWSGFAALTGSGYSGSMYAGYQAWSSQHGADGPPMEYMSMAHSRAAMLHMRPKVNDTLVSNLREPMLTMVEDTSSGIHDTLIAACDPPRYKGLGVPKWEEHGSCAENLVLALKELNERAGLKGAKGVGAAVTINSVPAPLNLFMNIPWDDEGDLGFHAPKCKKGDFVRLKAERDVVVVMSACPQDVLDINNKDPTDAHFLVEGGEEPTQAIKRTQVRKRPPPRKIASSRATSTVGTESGTTPVKKPVPQKRAVPQKKPAAVTASSTAKKPPTAGQASASPKKKPVPKAVAPQKKPVSTPTTDANGTASAPTEKKKPRKLSAKPKPEAQTAT